MRLFAGKNDRARHLAIFTMLVGLVVIALFVVAQIRFTTGSLNASGFRQCLARSGYLPAHDCAQHGSHYSDGCGCRVAFRSLAGALSASIAWFPIDNALVLIVLYCQN